MRLSPTRAGLGLMALALCAMGLYWWQQSDPAEVTSAPPVAQSNQPVPFVRSLQDTLPDGDLQSMQTTGGTTVSGALAYGELRRLFDYYLSTVGELSIEAITAHIHSELQRRLPPAQAQKAQRLLGLYIAFKRELVELDSRPELAGQGVAAIRKRLLAMQDLRARYFSADEAMGMFGLEDAYDMDAVARMEISQSPNLTEQQKKQQLAAMEAAMPENLRKERDASTVVVRVDQMAQDMRAKGASEDDIYRMRAKEFDPQAAARLAEVDRDEAAWKARIAHYQDERAKLFKVNANATDTERQASLAQLQQRLFTESERPRLAAYE